MNTMNETAIMATGRLCMTWHQFQSQLGISGRTNEYSKVERTRPKVVAENEPRCNRDGVCNVESSDRQCEYSTDSLGSGKRKKAKQGRYCSDEPDTINRSASEGVHAIEHA